MTFITRARKNWTFVKSCVGFLALVLAVVVCSDAPLLADLAERTPYRLPEGRHGFPSVWTGQYVFMFGGWTGGFSSDILRFDPETGEVIKMAEKLPFGLRGSAAAWDGATVYIFGGRVEESTSYQVLTYVPTTNKISILPGLMPRSAENLQAVIAEGDVFIFGGVGGNLDDRILRFDLATRQFNEVSVHLGPTGRPGTAGFYDGHFLYIVNEDNAPQSRIVRFNPLTSSLTPVKATLSRSYGSSGAFDGSSLYLFGGVDKRGEEYSTPRYDDIYRFDPKSDTTMLMRAKLPTKRLSTSAVAVGKRLFVLGGFGDQQMDLTHSPPRWPLGVGWLDEIVDYKPVPEAPLAVVALPIAQGGTRITWSPPDRASYGEELEGYNLYRSVNGSGFDRIGFATDTEYVDSYCPLGASCAYRVAAVNYSGEGSASLPTVAPGSRL